MDLIIRQETENDYREVEALTREAFWNLYVPGCDEHYLVHVMRQHPDFLPELDYVAVLDGKIVGNIMYAKSSLVSDSGARLETLTFGPVSVLPEHQRKGIGSALIRLTVAQAISSGYKAIVIYGHPHNYCKHGFVGSKSLNVSDADGRFPFSLLVLELEKGCLHGSNWKYISSDMYYTLDANDAAKYDATFPAKEKTFKPSQEEFRIASSSFVE